MEVCQEAVQAAPDVGSPGAAMTTFLGASIASIWTSLSLLHLFQPLSTLFIESDIALSARRRHLHNQKCVQLCRSLLKFSTAKPCAYGLPEEWREIAASLSSLEFSLWFCPNPKLSCMRSNLFLV